MTIPTRRWHKGAVVAVPDKPPFLTSIAANFRFAIKILIITLGLAEAATSALAGEREVGAESGLPLPRFVSLNADKVNLRTGPGVRYPIAWVFVRRGLPVEVIGEFELWRKVRDIDGAEGWAHKSLLSGRRMAVVTEKVGTLYREPSTDSVPVLFAEPGVQGRLLVCQPEWCELEVAGVNGWMPRRNFWGAYPGETLD